MSFIVPMEKPKRCGLCPCFHAEHPMHCQAVKANKDKRIIAPYGAPIPDWCPLIELPPHGRLIDADKLKSRLVLDNDSNELQRISADILKWIDIQETVIEGSET